jgi:TonB family protein
MPMSANDIAPLAATPAPAENSSAPSPGSRRTDAVGAEIAVTIHASRYSTASRGAASKNLPPIHEETRTVIIFPNGAVVRLSASITTGELVVLTNQRTGDDVICRVATVKAQPGTQNYVNLEFTQRSPSFWGDAMPADSVARTGTSALPHVFSSAPAQAPAQAAQAPLAQGLFTQALATPKISVGPDVVVGAPAARPAVVVPAAELISAVQAVTNLLSAVPPSGVRPVPSANPAQALAEKALTVSEPPAKASVPALLPSSESVPTPPQTSEVQAQPAPAEAPALAPGLSLPRSHGPLPEIAGGDVRRRKSTLPSTLNLSSVMNADSSDSGAATTADLAARAKLILASGSTAALMAPEWAKPAHDSVDTMGAIGTFGSDQKRPGSKNALMIAAAAVVLLIVGGAVGAVLFHQNRPAPAQQTTPSAEPASAIAAQPINSPEIEVPAVTKTVTDLDSESAQPRSASEIPPAKAQPARDDLPRRTNIAVGRLAAPIAKVARPSVSSEAPPELAAPSNLVDTNLLAAPRSNEPALPAAPSIAPGGQLKQPRLIYSPPASYPPAAQLHRVQGLVVIDAVVDTNGKVASMNVVSGPKELQDAAMRSVRNWKYQPAQLNGQPIPVHTQVTVNFQLQ